MGDNKGFWSEPITTTRTALVTAFMVSMLLGAALMFVVTAMGILSV